jgi:lactate dehydrogenase-like 2-hydroxyacid dehydrogenase
MGATVKLVSLGVRFAEGDKLYLSSSGFELEQYDQPGDLERAVQAAAGAGAVCVANAWLRRLGRDFVNRLEGCRLLVAGGSADMLDLDEASLRGISVANCPGYSAPAIAEQAFALLLALARRLNRRGERPAEPGLEAQEEMVRLWKGTELGGKTLGVLGHGATGRQLAAIGMGFGMRVLVAKRDKPWLLTRLLRHRGVTFSNFRDMLPQADVVISSLPGGMGSRRFFGAEAFAAMKPNCLFVNVGGANLVDEVELLSALESGRLAGAGLDGVTPAGAQALRQLKNVVITPHMGWNTEESAARFSAECAANVTSFFAGRPANLLLDARPAN